MKDFSLQLYSLREVPTLRQRMEIAAQAGYTGVEFAGYDGIAGPEMRRLLASLGLRGTGSHIAYDALRDDLDGCVRYCLEAGITSAACPGCEMNDRDQALAQAEFLEACAERFGAEGIPFAYHNHAHEFADAGNGETLFDVLLHNTSKLGAELDVFWAAYAGVDPLAFIQTYAGRVPLLHFKEFGAENANVELGRGCLDFAALARAGLAQGTRELIVEQEQYTMPPEESIRVDAAYMQALTLA
ncbi:sugar phosphate isomerase/epimerase family protein [Anaeromassilibacillus sp. SJQ-5]|jgi:AP endonuclease, family 2